MVGTRHQLRTRRLHCGGVYGDGYREIFIPQVGLFHGNLNLSKRLNSLPPEAAREINRRIDYLNQRSQNYDDSMIPEQPSLSDVLMSRVFGKSESTANRSDTGTKLSTLDALGPVSSASQESQKLRVKFIEGLREIDL